MYNNIITSQGYSLFIKCLYSCVTMTDPKLLFSATLSTCCGGKSVGTLPFCSHSSIVCLINLAEASSNIVIYIGARKLNHKLDNSTLFTVSISCVVVETCGCHDLFTSVSLTDFSGFSRSLYGPLHNVSHSNSKLTIPVFSNFSEEEQSSIPSEKHSKVTTSSL